MALKDTDDAKPEEQETDVSLDMSQTAVKKMIADARERGYITYEQLNTVLPPEQVSSEQIEDVMSMLSEMGINIIEDDEAEEGETGGELVTTDTTSRDVAVVTATTVPTTPFPSELPDSMVDAWIVLKEHAPVMLMGGIILGAAAALLSYIATWGGWEIASRIEIAKKLRVAKAA